MFPRISRTFKFLGPWNITILLSNCRQKKWHHRKVRISSERENGAQELSPWVGRRNCYQDCCELSQLMEIASTPCSTGAGFCFCYNWPNNKSRGLHNTIFPSQEGSLTGNFPSAANSTCLSCEEASLFVSEWETGLKLIPVLLTSFERLLGLVCVSCFKYYMDT